MRSISLALLLIFSLTGCTPTPETTGTKPNIVWIMMEDWGYDLSCYGAKGVYTPYIDHFALEGMRYTHSFCTAPVCSPSRSAMITGFHQLYIGANQHRTQGPGFEKKHLPYGIKPITHLLEEAGYFTCLMVSQKTDCNFLTDKPLFMGRDWSERAAGQPFFAQITFGGTHRKWLRDPERPIKIEDVELPPYYPDHPLARRDWANGLEAAQRVDRQIGEILQRLEEEGLAGNTLVFIIGDNGRCMPRGKQFLYDGGIQVPLLARWPGEIKPGLVVDDMVMTIDIAATILEVAGIDPGYETHGKSLFGREVKKRKYIFAARDKMDDTHDAMRAIRSHRYKLIQNLMPERAYCQYNRYKETSYPVLALLNVLNLRGELPPEQAAFMSPEKPELELYDLQADPFELNNLAGDPEYVAEKEALLSELNRWRAAMNDPGVSDAFRRGGWPATYPTRSLQEWEEILTLWEPWVFREPDSDMERPAIPPASLD
jgi:N-sulfoglucosamine sulfohydrolase